MVLIPLLHVICTTFVLVYAKPEGKALIVFSYRLELSCFSSFQIFWWIHINRISKLFRVFSDLPKRSHTYFFDYFIGWCANISSHSHVFKNFNEEIYPGLSSLQNRKPLRKIVLTYLYVLTWCDCLEIRTDFSEKLSHCYLWYRKNDVNRLSSNGTHGDAIGLCKVKNYYASRFASVNSY